MKTFANAKTVERQQGDWQMTLRTLFWWVVAWDEETGKVGLGIPNGKEQPLEFTNYYVETIGM